MSDYRTFKTIDKSLCGVFLNAPGQYKSVIITDNQIDILKQIQANMCYSTKRLASSRGLSVQSASAQLVKLWKTGYLKRRESNDATGGIIYLYQIADGVVVP